ncbi:cobalamin biosynthesis protein [Pseudonocardia xishanensis]|uniref:CobE/GbiG C-terminal domain-containing protein n=1 Tax=Pseudonocardia xishanensis TaxID=630995 RepID=A0ABP8RY77_9PSEU
MIVVGIGARRGVSAAEVRAALAHLAARVPLDGAVFASVDAKAAEQGILDAIAPATLRTRPAAELAAVHAAGAALERPAAGSGSAGSAESAAGSAALRSGRGSARADAAVGTPSVAEAAALRVAGAGAVLLVPKTVVGRVTVACASGQGDV